MNITFIGKYLWNYELECSKGSKKMVPQHCWKAIFCYRGMGCIPSIWVEEFDQLTSFFSYLGTSISQFSPLSEAGSSPILAAQTLTALGPSCSLIQGQREREEAFCWSLTGLVWRMLCQCWAPVLSDRVPMCSLFYEGFVCLLLCGVCVLQISWFSSVETLIL